MGQTRGVQRIQKPYCHLRASALDRAPERPRYGRGYKPAKFHENILIGANGRPVIFYLQKEFPTVAAVDDFLEIKGGIGIAYERNNDAHDSGIDHCEQFECLQEAMELFNEYGIPRNLWNRRSLATARALYLEYASKSDIRVPGYLKEMFVVNTKGMLASYTDPIPQEQQSEFENILRAQGLDGRITFWPEE